MSKASVRDISSECSVDERSKDATRDVRGEGFEVLDGDTVLVSSSVRAGLRDDVENLSSRDVGRRVDEERRGNTLLGLMKIFVVRSKTFALFFIGVPDGLAIGAVQGSKVLTEGRRDEGAIDLVNVGCIT